MNQQETLLAARQRMQGALLSTIAPSGFLLGLDTLGGCMKDEGMRAYLGHALLDEIMPCVDELPRGQVEQLAMALCREMEGPLSRQPVLPFMQNGVSAWAVQALPLLERYEKARFALPPCLCFGLAALIMFFAGARRDAAGVYQGFRAGESYPLAEDETILSAFSRLSCDMPPESLAYAVLSDQDIWERDLRMIPGLEEQVADGLRDLQLLGLRAAMEKSWVRSQA